MNPTPVPGFRDYFKNGECGRTYPSGTNIGFARWGDIFKTVAVWIQATNLFLYYFKPMGIINETTV